MEDIEKLNEYVEIFAGFRSLCKDKVGEMSDSDILTLFAIALKDIRANSRGGVTTVASDPQRNYTSRYKPKNPVKKEPGGGPVRMSDKQRKLLLKLASQLGETEEELMERVKECKTPRDLHNLVGEYIRRAKELKKGGDAE